VLPDHLFWELIFLFFLVGCSAFFSSSETALISLSKIRLRGMVEDNVKNADTISNLLDNPNKLIGAILIGNNVVNIGASALATSIAIDLYGSKGTLISTVAMTLLILIFGEVTPKSLAAQYSEQTSIKVAKNVFYSGLEL